MFVPVYEVELIRESVDGSQKGAGYSTSTVGEIVDQLIVRVGRGSER